MTTSANARATTRSVILTALLLTALPATNAAAQESSPLPGPVTAREPNFGIYVAEAGGATAGAILGLGLGWGTAFVMWMTGTSEERTILPAVLVGVPATVAGCAGGACLMGSAFQQEGKYLPTLCWTAGGLAAGTALVIGGNQIQNSDIQAGTVNWIGYYTMAAGYLVLLTTPEIATIGYNRSRPRESVGGRFLPGSVALGSVRDADGLAHPSLDVRLVNVRF